MNNYEINNLKFGKKPALFTLTMLISLASMGSVLPAPALTNIAESYSILPHQAEWVVTMFVLGYALSQIFYGPISNSIGRKKTLYIGISISIVGGIVSSMATDFSMLVLGRLIMAIGSGCGLNMTFTIINDCYENTEARKVIAYTTSAFAILPGLAIFLGGELTTYVGWRSCFIFLTVFSVFALFLAKTLPETHHKNNRITFSLRNIAGQYRKAFSNPKIYVYTGLWGFSTAIIYVVSATASIVSVRSLGLTANGFSQLFMIIMALYFVGNIITAKLSDKATPKQLFIVGAIISTLGAILLVGFNQFVEPSRALFFIPLALVYLGLPMIFSTASAQAMHHAVDKSTTSSVVSFMIMMIAFLSSSGVSTIQTNLYHYLPVIILGLMLVINVLIMVEVKVAKQYV